jgi:hypothetical protein
MAFFLPIRVASHVTIGMTMNVESAPSDPE